MFVTAKLHYLRIAPRKVRLVADLIRGKTAEEAQVILNFTQKRAVVPILKLLKSAIANAKHNFQLEQSNLYISKILVNEGPKLKRWRTSSRGRVAPIKKRTSHIILILEEIEKRKAKRVKTKKAEKAEKSAKTIIEKPSKESKLSAEQTKFKPEKEFKRPKRRFGLRKIFQRKTF